MYINEQIYIIRKESKMETFEYKTHIRYTDINENNKLSDKGILNILSEAAGVHSEVVRILCKQY